MADTGNSTTVLFQTAKQIASNLENPHETALVLLAYVLERPKTWVLAHPEISLSTDQVDRLEALTRRLQAGEPLPYLTGRQEFFGLMFHVSPAVLIPRPETELLVEEALAYLIAHPTALSVLDAGTGSGCIAVSLALLHPALSITATDLSEDALAVARNNVRFYQLEDRIALRQADLYPQDCGPFHLVCANLPYIPTEKLSEVNSLPFEPRQALDGGPDGLREIRKLFARAASFLIKPGMLLVEIESSLGTPAVELAQSAFPSATIDLLRDLTGRDRLLKILLEH